MIGNFVTSLVKFFKLQRNSTRYLRNEVNQSIDKIITSTNSTQSDLDIYVQSSFFQILPTTLVLKLMISGTISPLRENQLITFFKLPQIRLQSE